MGRLLPLWLVLLCLLICGLLAVLFAWVVNDTASGKRGFGRVGDAAVVIASFPNTVKSTFNEIGEDPDSHIRVPRPSGDLSGFRPVKMRQGINVQGLLVRADEGALARARGWRVVVGAFTIDGSLEHAALVISPDLEIVKSWILTEKDIKGKDPQPPTGKFIHGFVILKDGSVVFTFDVGVSLQRFDRCGARVWAIGGSFDHAVTLEDNEEFVWTLSKDDIVDEIVRVRTANGEIVRRVTMEDIIAANPAIDILAIRQKDNNAANGNPRNTSEKWLDDAFHLNDVEPLPASLAGQFEDFKAGDLLLSARSLNLVFVIDPIDLKVKWWRSGPWRRQHDPDWQPTGEITVFDNRMSRDYSRIVGIEPASLNTRVLLDGSTNDFYSRIRGKHQVTPNGNLLVASSQQGRIFEMEPDGRTVLEILNTKPGSDEFNYPLSEAIWLAPDTLDLAKDFSCAN